MTQSAYMAHVVRQYIDTENTSLGSGTLLLENLSEAYRNVPLRLTYSKLLL